jgi:quinohemoprotein ethanol dehydrogenase
MYTSGNWGAVYALDAASGRLLWKYEPHPDGQFARNAQNDVVNHGVVVWKGRVYVITTDCYLHALDARTGKTTWEANTLVDPRGYFCSGAPQLAGDLVVAGNGGADSSPGGVRGFVSAYDAASGQLRWRFYTVPAVGDRAPTPEMRRAAATWDPQRDRRYGGGGTVWDSMAYDPTLGLLYLGTGNAAPYGAPRAKSGTATDNLYAASIIALHADSGRMAWYFQTTPGDRWDFDATASMVLADIEVSGKRRAALLQANKNGYFYVLDRGTGKPISAHPYSYVSWARGLDAAFRPLVAPEADWSAKPQLLYPSVQGAHNWPPMAYSPRTGLAYIPAIDAPGFLVNLEHNPGAQVKTIDAATVGAAYVIPDRSYDAEYWKPIVGGLPRVPTANPKNGKALVRSVLRAWDPVRGQIAWEQQTSDQYLVVDGGTLATAGDLVFAGREDGWFVAYDARTGEVLKKIDTGTPIMAAPMTYAIAGTQYIAVMAAHGGGYLGSFVGTAAMKYVNDARILVFKLDGAAQVPKPEVRHDEPWTKPPVAAANSAQVRQGTLLFAQWCARCHSLGVPGVTPDLSRLRDGIASADVFDAIVRKGALVSRGMARFDDALSAEEVGAIHAYLVDQAWQAYNHQASSGTGAAGPPRP